MKKTLLILSSLAMLATTVSAQSNVANDPEMNRKLKNISKKRNLQVDDKNKSFNSNGVQVQEFGSLSAADIEELDNILGYQQLPSGLYYKFTQIGSSNRVSNVGDVALLNIKVQHGDTTYINTEILNNGKPVPEILKNPSFQGDIAEGILMMKPGDEAIFKLHLDTLEKRTGSRRHPGIQHGQYAIWTIHMENAMSPEEYEALEFEEMKSLIAADEKVINKYIKDNKLKAERLPSGVYIVYHHKANGEKPSKGQQVTVNYTGKLLNGKVFDSNVDPKFNHVQPFTFQLGAGRVIKGWDYGVAAMGKGDKATLIIPSALAYGKRSPSKDIPENAIMLFDIELTSL